MRVIQLPAIFSGVKSRKDRSYRLEFDTREAGGELAAELLSLHMDEVHLLIAANEKDLNEVDVPQERPNAMLGNKTQAQRLRGCIYRLWEQGGKQGDSESYYRSVMERFIEQVKEKLE